MFNHFTDRILIIATRFVRSVPHICSYSFCRNQASDRVEHFQLGRLLVVSRFSAQGPIILLIFNRIVIRCFELACIALFSCDFSFGNRSPNALCSQLIAWCQMRGWGTIWAIATRMVDPFQGMVDIIFWGQQCFLKNHE